MEDSGVFDKLGQEITEFARQRGWDTVATAKDLAAAIAIEVGELQELLLWVPAEDEDEYLRVRSSEFSDELADILIYAIRFARYADIDLQEAIARKLERNADRFPLDG